MAHMQKGLKNLNLAEFLIPTIRISLTRKHTHSSEVCQVNRKKSLFYKGITAIFPHVSLSLIQYIVVGVFMGLLSATTSLSRYKVTGKLDDPVLDTIAAGLKKNVIADIDDNPSDRAVGWSSFQDPFKPNFDGSSFMIGTYIVFALRIDRKSIPNKMVQKHVAAESAKRLHDLGRDSLSANEKKIIKDHVINKLSLKMPSTPNVYDVLWQYETGDLWFFSNLKSANEELETLFIKSFGVSLVRSIPYTMAVLDPRMTNDEHDALNKLSAQQDR